MLSLILNNLGEFGLFKLWEFRVLFYDHTAENTGKLNGIVTKFRQIREWYWEECKKRGGVLKWTVNPDAEIENLLLIGDVISGQVPDVLLFLIGVGCVDHFVDLFCDYVYREYESDIGESFKLFQRNLL